LETILGFGSEIGLQWRKFPVGLEVVHVDMGSFDFAAASLRGAATALRMTGSWDHLTGILGRKNVSNNKNPGACATGFARHQVKETCSGYFLNLRRMVPAKPIRPVPSSVKVPGSGTMMLVSPPERVAEVVKRLLPVLTVNWTVTPLVENPLAIVPLNTPVKV